MRCIKKTIEHGSRSDTFRLVLLSDAHLGNRAADERLLARWVKDIKDTPNTFWVDLGDTVDGVGRMDKRHREETLATWCHGTNRIFKRQRERAIEMFQPIGHKCLARVMGNHEEYLETYGADLYYSVSEGIADDDDIDLSIGMSGYLMLIFRRRSGNGNRHGSAYRIYMHHGAGGGRLLGSKAIKLERLPASYEADIYVMGHTHTKLTSPAVVESVTRAGKIVSKEMLLVNTGGFLANSLEETTTYSERNQYKPQSLGPVVLELTPGADNPADRMRAIL